MILDYPPNTVLA